MAERTIFSQIALRLKYKNVSSWGEDFRDGQENISDRDEDEKSFIWNLFINSLSEEDLGNLDGLEDHELGLSDDLRNTILVMWINHPRIKKRLKRLIKEWRDEKNKNALVSAGMSIDQKLNAIGAVVIGLSEKIDRQNRLNNRGSDARRAETESPSDGIDHENAMDVEVVSSHVNADTGGGEDQSSTNSRADVRASVNSEDDVEPSVNVHTGRADVRPPTNVDAGGGEVANESRPPTNADTTGADVPPPANANVDVTIPPIIEENNSSVEWLRELISEENNTSRNPQEEDAEVSRTSIPPLHSELVSEQRTTENVEDATDEDAENESSSVVSEEVEAESSKKKPCWGS